MKSALVYTVIVLLALVFGFIAVKAPASTVNKAATNIKAQLDDRKALLDKL